jgi:hypothetical protein
LLPFASQYFFSQEREMGLGSTKGFRRHCFAAAAGVVTAASMAHAATVTPIVKLNFTNPTVGAYGADPGSSTLPANTSAASYTETGATYSGNNYAYTDTSGNGPTFANGVMSIASGSSAQEPGLSVGAGSSTDSLSVNYVYEAEITSAGPQNSSTPADIIQWENDSGTPAWLQFRLGNGAISAYASGSGNGGNSINLTTGTTLVTGVETHVAMVYTYSSTGPATISLYTINDSTGQSTLIGSGNSGGVLDQYGTDLSDQIGILNAPEDEQNAGTGNRAFNGSIDSVLVATWTGTFDPSDGSAGGDFQLTSTPEPTSLGLAGAGALLALMRRRKLSLLTA